MRPFPEAPYAGKPPTMRRRLSSAVRPRLTWRYVACMGGALYLLYCWLSSLPLFAHSLPPYSGPYAVGAVDIEAPLESPRLADDARFRASKQNAFELRTVLFTLYYPAERVASRRPLHSWIPKPISVTAKGYAKFAHIGNFITNAILTGAVKLLVGGIRIPAQVDVPLAGPEATLRAELGTKQETQTILEGELEGFPVIVFSHGMASSRTDYTHYAGELASRGYVVAMIEHRDGSCPGSVIKQAGKPDEVRLTFRQSEVEFPDGKKLETDEFKKAQLNFREAEIEETVRILKLINSGYGKDVFQKNPYNEGFDLRNWAGSLNTDAMIIAGHSYGATGALQALKGGQSQERPFKGGIILDPGKSSGQLNEDISVPVLVIHSNSWSSKYSLFYGRAHFDVVAELVQTNNDHGHPSWFMTSLGTSHPSVTDAPLLEPLLLRWTTGAKINVYEGLRQYVHMTEDFLWFLEKGEKRNLLDEEAEFPQYDGGRGFGVWKPGQGQNREAEGQWWDWRRYWQVHVAPDH
ncbi:PAF acetylhydrolase [Xylariomycetidae sp. FL0641]|nr:PAF acetylhydrolase [Xylariomycetidae sp. FL0641]